MTNNIIGTTGKKFAIIIGINYNNSANQLNGCINDANNLKMFLTSKCGYLPQNIIMLTDDGLNTKPTRQNIINSFNTLIDKAIKEQFTELWFSYSGHGSYILDTNKDELDKNDELICPVDFDSNGFIIDDYIYSDLICKLPSTSKLFCLMDCCNSGSVCDLPLIYDTVLTTNNTNNKHSAKVISISGCRDNQLSADAYIAPTYEGAMTWSFLKTLKESNYHISLLDLVKKMRLKLLASNFTQVPLLALSNSAELNDTFIQLIDPIIDPIINQDQNQTTLKLRTVTFTMKVDNWYRESKWNVWSDVSQKNIFPTDNLFSSANQTTIQTIKLLPGTYKLRLWDSYGDGGIAFLIKRDITVILSSKMITGKYAEYIFTV